MIKVEKDNRFWQTEVNEDGKTEAETVQNQDLRYILCTVLVILTYIAATFPQPFLRRGD